MMKDGLGKETNKDLVIKVKYKTYFNCSPVWLYHVIIEGKWHVMAITLIISIYTIKVNSKSVFMRYKLLITLITI